MAISPATIPGALIARAIRQPGLPIAAKVSRAGKGARRKLKLPPAFGTLDSLASQFVRALEALAAAGALDADRHGRTRRDEKATFDGDLPNSV